MTVEVRTMNLLLETHGGARHQGGATWYFFIDPAIHIFVTYLLSFVYGKAMILIHCIT